MLDLLKYESEAIANHRQQQQDLDNLLPIIEETGALIIEKLALFKKYTRKVRADVTHNGSHILLSVVITKIAPKACGAIFRITGHSISLNIVNF